METKEIKEVKEKVFIKLSDLTDKDLKKQGFEIKNVVLERRPTKNGYRYSIKVDLHEMLNIELSVPPRFVTEDRFNLILLKLGLDQKDKLGRTRNRWVVKASVRFVKGLTSQDIEYQQIEILFKQYLYESHFFTSDQQRVLEELINQKLIKVNWSERPDKIDIEVDSDSQFVF
jgi:hypothetical protein